MLPNPLHPAVVHFPIVLALLAPAVALAVLVATRRSLCPQRAWLGVVALVAATSLSAWVSVETGERDEERVESVVAESAVAAHESSAERLLALSGLLTVLSLVGMLAGRVGTAARISTTAAAFALVPLVWQTGHSGGAMVYRADATGVAREVGGAPAREQREDEDQERRSRPRGG
jgi:uncharacterized membrane protein